MNRRISIIGIWILSIMVCFITSCNKDEDITKKESLTPKISLDSETGIYTVKVGKSLTITPDVQYADNAIYTWIIDNKIVSTSPSLTVCYKEAKEVYALFRVETLAGTAEEEIRIDVLEMTPPVISLALPTTGLKVLPNTEYVFAPDIQHADEEGFKIEWRLDNKVVSTDATYTFCQAELGTYNIAITASNIDGETHMDFNVDVIETLPQKVSFPSPSYYVTTTDRNTVVGRTVYITPDIEYIDNPTYQWTVDDSAMDVEGQTLKFTPNKAGDYRIKVTVADNHAGSRTLTRNVSQGNTTITAELTVHCYTNEDAMKRPATASSSALQNNVYEFLPAPGQFVNELNTAGYTSDITTHAKAVEYAEKRLLSKNYVSLGGFGGYVIVGFDHSVVAGQSNYDFAIIGNAFNSSNGGSNEPGIVWVMQDTNGNGLPDDEWYELKGCETGQPTTLQDHKVTYYRPSGPKMDVQWKDSEGQSGKIKYLGAFHQQDYYYPLWMKKECYTLRGTRLKANNTVDPATGYWANNPFGWGYADNMGNDCLGGSSIDGSGQCNGFKISNAIYPDGTPVKLGYIDFIKVQTGVNAQSGSLGENSTEVFSFQDYFLVNK